MVELADIIRAHGSEYLQKHKLPSSHHKALRAIVNCRTAALGGHMDACDECGYVHISYNSCRNRHCPKCQALAKERWIDARLDDLLPVQYFHVVFTIPEELNTLAFQNQRIIYGVLFKAVAETLAEIAVDKKYLGAQIGFTSILHTWGQNLMHHPHIHCIVPGGGLNSIQKWVNSKEKFFIPVKVLSKKFRGKFLYYIKQSFDEGILSFKGKQESLSKKADFYNHLSPLYEKNWFVYCKRPFKDASCVVKYLSRYTHRIAISNNRITHFNSSGVTFNWRDYKDTKKVKSMVLKPDEFIRRFLIHILPDRFIKIRHYGFLSSRNKKTKLSLCKRLTSAKLSLKLKMTTAELMQKITGRDITLCPACKIGKLIWSQGLSPPENSQKDNYHA